MDEARPAARCEICGSAENQLCMFSCIQCNGSQHRYCMAVAEFEMRYDWCCFECEKKSNGDTKPIQGEKTEFQRPDTSHRNAAHQIGVKTPQIYENSKVKFIPCEEAALLNRGRPAVHYTRRFVARRTQVHPASPPSMKCTSPSRQVNPASPPSMKCISPSRQVHPASTPNMKCISPSRQVHPESLPNMKHSSSMKSTLPSRKVRPASPRSMKQSCSMKCVSPSRSDGQAFSLKRCAVASQNLIKVYDTRKRQKMQSGATIPMIPQNIEEVQNFDQQLQEQPKEDKVPSADRGTCNSWVDDEPTGQSAPNASVPTDADIGCGSGTKSTHKNIDMPVVISSSAEFARRPPPEAIWTGCFLLADGESSNLGEFKAYLPSVVSSRVCNIANKMPNNIQLKILPRMNYWPKTFEKFCPVYDDIALLFFSDELDCYNKKHPHLLEAHCGFVMKAYIDDMMLLIYSSEVLPPDSQWIDGESYLWGVFVKPKPTSTRARLDSVAT